MNRSYTRLAASAVLALGVAGLVTPSAQASSDPLTDEAVAALAVAHCQADPANPLTAEELAPVVVGWADVDVVPGEITAHVLRLEVAGTSECAVGVLHRDAQLKQVAYEGTATVAGTVTEIELGNMGKSSPIDPTTEVDLPGSLVPLADATEDPAFDISLVRKSLQTVQIAVHRTQKDAAARLLKAQTKAAANLLRKQEHAASHGKHADKALATAQKQYDMRIAAAQKDYDNATAPRSVTLPVGLDFSVSGSVPRSDVQG